MLPIASPNRAELHPASASTDVEDTMGKNTRPGRTRDALMIAACLAAIGLAAGLDGEDVSPSMGPVREAGPESAVVAAPAPDTHTPAVVTPPASTPDRRTTPAGSQVVRRTAQAQPGLSLRPATATRMDTREASAAPELDYRADVYRYREPAVPDGRERERALARCEEQARHIPAGERLTYGDLARGSLQEALDYCAKHYGAE